MWFVVRCVVFVVCGVLLLFVVRCCSLCVCLLFIDRCVLLLRFVYIYIGGACVVVCWWLLCLGGIRWMLIRVVSLCCLSLSVVVCCGVHCSCVIIGGGCLLCVCVCVVVC